MTQKCTTGNYLIGIQKYSESKSQFSENTSHNWKNDLNDNKNGFLFLLSTVKPDDVTGVVSFLVGPDAKFITGQTIAIDGGWSIQWIISI